MRYIANIGIPEREMEKIDACFYRNCYGHQIEITFPNGAPFSIGSHSYSGTVPEYRIAENLWDGWDEENSDHPQSLIGIHVLDNWEHTYELRISRTEGEELEISFEEAEE